MATVYHVYYRPCQGIERCVGRNIPCHDGTNKLPHAKANYLAMFGTSASSFPFRWVSQERGDNISLSFATKRGQNWVWMKNNSVTEWLPFSFLILRLWSILPIIFKRPNYVHVKLNLWTILPNVSKASNHRVKSLKLWSIFPNLSKRPINSM